MRDRPVAHALDGGLQLRGLERDDPTIRPCKHAMALGTSTTSQSPDAGNGAVPMEIDCVKGKDKGKGKKGTRKGGKDSKGKGKTKNDGKAKDYGKCNAGGQGKGKTLPVDTRKVCGARGHWGRECLQSNLRQVSQVETRPTRW